MRILHVVPSYIPAYRYGGPIRSVHGLCKGLAIRGHDVHVFTTNVDGEKDSDVPLGIPVDIDGVKVWYFPSEYFRRIYWSPRMKKALDERAKEFDLLHLHSIFLWPTWAAARASRHAQLPYLIAPRGMLVPELVRRKSSWIKMAWINLIEKSNLENAAAIHVTSKTEADEAARFGFRLPKIVTVPNGVDVPITLPSPLDHNSPLINEILGNGPYLLFLGRINWKKGLDRLIPALPHAGYIKLVIAGNDEENYTPELERLAKKHGVIDRIIFTGPVYDADKAALFNSAEAFVLTSYSENFGIAALEAMAAGCPVVVTPEVGAADIVRESGAGIVLKGEPEELGSGLKKLLSDTKRLEEMGNRGRRAVADGYTWAVVAGRMEEVYKNIISDNVTSSHA